MIEKKSTYLSAKNSLDSIIEQVRSKDFPLEKALDLYEEAIRIGNSCAELIDKTDFSMEELEAFNTTQEAAEEVAEEDAGATAGEVAETAAEGSEEAEPDEGDVAVTGEEAGSSSD